MSAVEHESVADTPRCTLNIPRAVHPVRIARRRRRSADVHVDVRRMTMIDETAVSHVGTLVCFDTRIRMDAAVQSSEVVDRLP